MKTVHIFGKDNIPANAIGQFDDAMAQDFSVAGALMPDAHWGYSLPIGGVVATVRHVLPAWVGYDIGCGMCNVRTTYNRDQIEKNREKIFDSIYKKVPVGFQHHVKPIDHVPTVKGISARASNMWAEKDVNCQLGTLGGNNHFINIGYESETNDVYITVHSGSRGFGWGIAYRYMCLASNSDKPQEGHFAFDIDSDVGQEYLADMDFCVSFALQNRCVILDQIDEAIKECDIQGASIPGTIINKTHNHVDFSHELGLWIHRKGATQAGEGVPGVIPGTSRDGILLVQGKGNIDSLFSSSHGAGRTMSRREAKKTFTTDDMKTTLAGIQTRTDRCDEHPDSYKNIFEVMSQQTELVDAIHHLRTIINVQG